MKHIPFAKHLACGLILGAVAVVTPVQAEQAATTGDSMGDMEKTMQQIQATKDPNQRMELMQKHMDQMHAAMREMHGMMGGSGMAGGSGMMAGCQEHMPEMRKMMEQMMQQMQAEKQEMKKFHDHTRMRGGAGP
jgi:hypothetical protein